MTKTLAHIATLFILLCSVLVACSHNSTEQRSQMFYATNLCAPALASENADTLYERAYNNFAVTSNDPVLGSAFWHDCNIKYVSAEASAFIRQLFTLNDMCTDISMCAWDNSGIDQININQLDRVSGNLKPAEGMYMRLICGILICNKYLHKFASESETKQAEMRFLRALNYYYLLDLFGKAPIFKFYTDNNVDISPKEELYSFIEHELIESLPFLPDGKSTSDFDSAYGRANKTAALMLLDRLYLNATTYIGVPQWDKAADIAREILGGPYKLSTIPLYNSSMNISWSGYQQLFAGDNGSNGSSCEIVFPIRYDSRSISDWNGTTYLICSTYHYDTKFLPNINNLGVTQPWSGNRARANLIEKFLPDSIPFEALYPTMVEWAHDDRALFQSLNRQLSCRVKRAFYYGFSTVKFNNLNSASAQITDLPQTASTDFPLFRLAETYLTLAEAEWRLGNDNEALKNINIVRQRANALPISSIDNMGYAILDEWAREFYFEGRRRTDLIRFNCFGGDNDYLWQWKGGSILGHKFDEAMNYYSLPVDSLITATNKGKISMYYMIGNGVGDGSWVNSDGKNIGNGMVPMCIVDSTSLQFSDFFDTNAGFKMLRDFYSWDEQFGAGDYPGETAHNVGSSTHFKVNSEGTYRISLSITKEKVSIEKIDDKLVSNYKNLFLWVNHGKNVMKRCSNSSKTHVWMADFESEGGDILINISSSPSANKDLINLTGCTRYGIPTEIDNRGRIVLHTANESQMIRVIYNDIDNSLYSFKLEDEHNPEDEIPEDIHLSLNIDKEYKTANNAYALKYSFVLPKNAIVHHTRIGLTDNENNNTGVELAAVNSNSVSNGTVVIYEDKLQEAKKQLKNAITYRFTIQVEFSLHGDLWSATGYSTTIYD